MTVHTDPNLAHAVYAPSAAHRWGSEDGCTASATAIAAMERVVPSEDSEESADGTAAHDEIERILGPLNDVPVVGGGDFIAHTEAIDVDHVASFGIALFVDFVRKLVSAMPGRVWVEQRVRLTDQIWGRLDFGHWNAASATLTVIDYKNGYLGVDAEENEQFRIYAAALILQYNLPVEWIRYVCVQPNDFRPVPRVKQWIETAKSLRAFAERVAAIPYGLLTFRFGSHCRDCPLLGACEPTRDLLPQLGAMMARGPSGVVPPHLIPLFLALKKPIDHFFEGLMKTGTKKALAGDFPPGMILVTAQKHRTWISEQKARDAIIAAKGVEALKPPTPAQAEAMGIDIEGLADKPPGGPALAFASDKRPVWAPKTSAQMFAGIPGVTNAN